MLNLMHSAQKLSKEQMKMIVGGEEDPGCPTAECSTNADCTNSQFGHTCYVQTCLATGANASFCYNP